MHEELLQLLQTPNSVTYLAFRERLIASDAYEPYSDELDTAIELYQQKKFATARRLLQSSMGNLMLSPRAHQLLKSLNLRLGHAQNAELEMEIWQACLNGILDTGDGSENRPFIITRTSDEHDVIEHLKKKIKLQSLIHKRGKHFDLIRCTDGTVYWFDISDAYDQMPKSFGQ